MDLDRGGEGGGGGRRGEGRRQEEEVGEGVVLGEEGLTRESWREGMVEARWWWWRWWRSPVMLLVLLCCAAVSLAARQFDATWRSGLHDDYDDEIRRRGHGDTTDYSVEEGEEEEVVVAHHRKRDTQDPFYERIGSYRRNRAIDSRYSTRRRN